jgi:transcriptional regulator with XRE-family HTH domain
MIRAVRQTRGRSLRLTPEEVVGQRIREARLARGWTHEELARRMGVNWRTVQRWQKGKLPRLPMLLGLADVLGVPSAELVPAEEPPVTLLELQARVEELAARVDALARALNERDERLGGLLPTKTAAVAAVPLRASD